MPAAPATFRLLAAAVLGLLLLPARGDASGRAYTLVGQSSIVALCTSCGTPPSPPRPLSGRFQVTSLPIADARAFAAVTDLALHAEGLRIRGSGFIQNAGAERQSMVISATINGRDVLLRSGQRPLLLDDGMRLILSSVDHVGVSYILMLEATANVSAASDGDRDGIDDATDNCPSLANADQQDGDLDGVGDLCDACEGPSAGLINANGCTVEQICPCHEQRDGSSWESRAQYLRCVSAEARVLRREGQLSTVDAWRLVREAAKSGCGRPVIAML